MLNQAVESQICCVPLGFVTVPITMNMKGQMTNGVSSILLRLQVLAGQVI